jgi:DNA-binding transcriptional LysR family regulator
MQRSGLNELEVVLAIARHQSFRAAAVALEMSTTAVSNALAGLESRLGTRLFHRTTRSVSLTAAGQQFVAQIEPAVGHIRDAMAAVNHRSGAPHGTLRINTSLGAARMVMPLLSIYLSRYPGMVLDIVTEGRRVDIIAEGFDAGLRLAEQVPRDMIRVPIGPPLQLLVVGSPDCLQRHPEPGTPDDLAVMPCIRGRMPSGEASPWNFIRDGAPWSVDVPGALVLDSPIIMRDAALRGMGLAQLAESHVAEDLAAGRLVQVLANWVTPLPKLCLYYWGHRHIPPGLQALIELIHQQPH